MYCLAEIDGGGYIYAFTAAARRTVHKESVFPFRFQTLYERLSDAKEALKSQDGGNSPRLILAVEEGAGATALWCDPDEEEEIRKRLKTWSGCYGAWPVRRLNR